MTGRGGWVLLVTDSGDVKVYNLFEFEGVCYLLLQGWTIHALGYLA